MKFNLAVISSGVDLGIYEGDDQMEAIEAYAQDAGYSSFRDMCSITDPEDLDAKVDARLADLAVEAVDD